MPSWFNFSVSERTAIAVPQEFSEISSQFSVREKKKESSETVFPVCKEERAPGMGTSGESANRMRRTSSCSAIRIAPNSQTCKSDADGYLASLMTGGAYAFVNVMDTREPLRTLFTKAGRKQAMHVPALCRTLG